MAGPDDWLPLSGIQHFCFCRRQWALIHLEQQWAENRRTVEGQLDHARCHDANQTERRGGLLITRGMQVPGRPGGHPPAKRGRALEAHACRVQAWPRQGQRR